MFHLGWSFLVMALSIHEGIAQEDTPPPSPCPSVFGYKWTPAGTWQGSISIVPPLQFSEVQLVLKLSLPYHHPEAGIGRLEVEGGNAGVQEVSMRAFRGQPQTIQYIVVFPPFKQIPRVTSVVINGKEFCPAPQTYPDTRGTIELHYELKTSLMLPISPGNDFSVASGQASQPLPPSQPSQPSQPASQTDRQPTPSNTPASVPPLSTRAPTPPSMAPDAAAEYLAIINGHSSHLEAEPTITTTTGRPKPRPKLKPRPKPNPTTTTPEDEDEETVDDDISQYEVNSDECGLAVLTSNLLVVRGEETEKGQWPWLVAMFKQSNTGLTFQCGGTLLSRRHIITAAHCVYLKAKNKPVDTESVLIYLGKHNLRSWTEPGQQAKDVETITLHPQYGKKNHEYDIAILTLSTPADYSDYVKPVCLWDKPPELTPLVNKPGSVLGWGKDEKGSMANTLKIAKMPVVSQETCLRSDTFYSIFTSENTFCAGFKNGTSVCNGDSGGGMFFYLDNPKRGRKTWYTRGVVSVSMIEASEGGCDDRSYVIFTDIAKLLPWVKETMAPPSNVVQR